MTKIKNQLLLNTIIILLLSFCLVSCEKDLSKKQDNVSGEKTSSILALELAYPDQRGTSTEINYNGQQLAVEKIEDEYVYQGDIILQPSKNGKGVGRSLRRFIWPNNTVFYTIDSNLTNQQRVIDAIDHWESNTNLRFIERTNQPNYIDFIVGSGCSSSVGMIGGRQLIRLSTGCSVGSTIHEIGHAIGLWHEQSKTSRDFSININYDNIQSGRRHNFDTHEERNQDGRNFNNGIDFQSIMMYHPCSFAIACLPAQLCNCTEEEATITRWGGLYTTQRNGLSNNDIRSVRKMYPLSSPWLTNNTNGLTTRSVTTSNVKELKIRELDGSGIVGLSIKSGRVTHPMQSAFKYSNPWPRTRTIAFSNSEDFATGFEIKEQYGYGIIDIRLTNENSKTPWATGNNNEDRILRYNAPQGMRIRGFQAQEQEGYGIVDIRAILEIVNDWHS